MNIVHFHRKNVYYHIRVQCLKYMFTVSCVGYAKIIDELTTFQPEMISLRLVLVFTSALCTFPMVVDS